jgi:hypothetical protein
MGRVPEPSYVLALDSVPSTSAEVYLATRPVNGIEAVSIVPAEGEAPAAGGTWHGARVLRVYAAETVRHWDDGVTPGVTRLAFVAALPGVDAVTFRRRYEGHAAIARVEHPGICRYVQHFVTRGSEPDCAAISELHFATDEDMRNRFYRRDDSPAVVDADIGDYLDRTRTFSVVGRSGAVTRG